MKEEDKLVHCFIAFFDIRGFGSFNRRVTDPILELIAWRKVYRKVIDDFESNTGFLVKRTGDGVAIFYEVNPVDAWFDATLFLDKCWMFLMEMKDLRRKKVSPRYDGVRIRCSYGAVWREPCIQLGKDYYGDKINLTEKMIHQHKETCFLVTESLKELLRKSQSKKSGYKFQYVGLDRSVPCDPIYEPDMKLLWSFQKRKR